MIALAGTSHCSLIFTWKNKQCQERQRVFHLTFPPKKPHREKVVDTSEISFYIRLAIKEMNLESATEKIKQRRGFRSPLFLPFNTTCS